MCARLKALADQFAKEDANEAEKIRRNAKLTAHYFGRDSKHVMFHKPNQTPKKEKP